MLVCDDYPVVRDGIRACVHAIAPDAEVGLCSTAHQALERRAEHGFRGLVVLDLTLPTRVASIR